MSVMSKNQCPRCRTRSKASHCKTSPYCSWWYCTNCPLATHIAVFSGNKFFTVERYK